MPLGKNVQSNIEELSSRCKHEGGFGNIRGFSKGKCQQIAKGAAYSASRRAKRGKRGRSR